MKLALWQVSAALVALASTVSAAPSRAATERRGASFDYAAHLGNLAPYQDAPVPYGMTADLPDDCAVDQVMLVRSRVLPEFAYPCPPRRVSQQMLARKWVRGR